MDRHPSGRRERSDRCRDEKDRRCPGRRYRPHSIAIRGPRPAARRCAGTHRRLRCDREAVNEFPARRDRPAREVLLQVLGSRRAAVEAREGRRGLRAHVDVNVLAVAERIHRVPCHAGRATCTSAARPAVRDAVAAPRRSGAAGSQAIRAPGACRSNEIAARAHETKSPAVSRSRARSRDGPWRLGRTIRPPASGHVEREHARKIASRQIREEDHLAGARVDLRVRGHVRRQPAVERPRADCLERLRVDRDRGVTFFEREQLARVPHEIRVRDAVGLTSRHFRRRGAAAG